MLIRYKQYYLCSFFILVILLLSCTEDLFCLVSKVKTNNFIDSHTDFFSDPYDTINKVTKKGYDQTGLNFKKKQQTTTFSESDRSTPWSNAFNFKKVWGTTVDPRTGVLSAWVKTGSMLSNLGHGPDINLQVSYSSNALANLDGLGTGWNWNLTHFNLKTHQLTTSFGQNVYLHKQPDGHWWSLYHKFHDMYIQGDISTHFIITYANGLRETLNHQGYEVRLEQQDGWSVYFSYKPGTHLLQSIKDDEGHSIKLYRTKNYISVISQGNQGKPVVVLIHKKNNKLRSITLSSFGNYSDHGIYFNYTQHFMTNIDYPTGLKDRVIYNCSDEVKVPVRNISSLHALCTVIKEVANPGFGQPAMVNCYHYGKTNHNEHNYLGFNAGMNISEYASKDRLFEAPASYNYMTEQDNGIIREIRTYNKYHLMTDEKQVSDRTGHILSAVHYFFCRKDQRDGCAHISFADLPVFYSFPLKIVTQVWGDISDTPAVTTVMADYDSQGRMIRQTDSFGRVKINNYCPLKGDEACPAAAKGWTLGSLTESTTLYPAHTKSNMTSLSPIITRNYYHREINHNRTGYISVLDHQIQQAGKQQLTTTYYYYDNSKNLLTYGLLKKSILTGQQNGVELSGSVRKDYFYVKSPDSYTKTTYNTIELDQSKRQKSPYITISLFTNQVLKTEDTEKKDTDLYYNDRWDRLIRTERAIGTVFAASIHYNYTISENLNQVLITAVNGLQKKVRFDGAGRILTSFTEVIDKTGKQQPDHWWPVEKNRYDRYGRIAKKFSYIIDVSGHETMLEITQDYDDTGRAVQVHRPDGVTTVIRYDDSDRCVISYQQNTQNERSVISVSKANILSEPVKQWILPATKIPLSSVKSLCLRSYKKPEAQVSVITYDGFGRQITVRDPAGRMIRQRYDALGRLTDTIDPAGNRVHKVYNLTGQVIQSWIYPVSGGYYLLSSAGYNRAGQLIWSAGEDGKHTSYTYTMDGQIATVTTPSGHVFSWQYNNLNLPVSELADNQQQWIADYNPVTLNLCKKTDITGVTTYIYRDDGLIQQSTHTGKNNYPNYQLLWQYDNNRRIISTTDISRNKTNTQYDGLGRIASINYQPYQNGHTETLFLPAYDGFSRIQHIDYGSRMQRTFHYDLWGHKDHIIDIQNKSLLSEWVMNYDVDGNITMLSQKTQKTQYKILHYQYDVLDNLVGMYCQGSSGLPLCPHDTSFTSTKQIQTPVITRQHYTFTPLNRLASVQETLQFMEKKQTVIKVTGYHYTDFSAPLRLQQIDTTWNQKRSNVQNFFYDDMGNMTVDGQNNHIRYNRMNEVIEVVSSTGRQSNYTYDSSRNKVMERSQNDISYLFYRGDALINEKIISLGQNINIIGYLGVAKTTDGLISEYYENSYKGDIIGILRKNDDGEYKFSQRNIYSPYGMLWCKKLKTLPLYKQTLQGFDGERTDASTGWIFLGNGNRTYNPTGRYFLSEDPAGDGYTFGSNNPIMNTDPSGNSPQWLGEAFKWAGYISTMGLSALHQRWANITASVIQTGCTVATLGATVASAGSAALAGVIAGTVTIGSIPVVAAAMPVNKGLNIAGKIIGMTEVAITVATSLAGFMCFSAAGERVAAEDIPLGKIPFGMLKANQATNVVAGDEPAVLPSLVSTASTVVTSPSLTSLSLSQFLEQSPCFHRILDFSCLWFDDRQSVADTWVLLRSSPFAGNIACDTGCILLVYQLSGQALDISELAEFLCERQKFIPGDQLLPDHPYIEALKHILKSANKVSYHAYSYNIVTFSLDKLKDLFYRSDCLLLTGYNHMAVVKKLTKSFGRDVLKWEVSQFGDDGMTTIRVNSNTLNKEIFPNPLRDELLLNAYMRIKVFSEE